MHSKGTVASTLAKGIMQDGMQRNMARKRMIRGRVMRNVTFGMVRKPMVISRRLRSVRQDALMLRDVANMLHIVLHVTRCALHIGTQIATDTMGGYTLTPTM